MKTTITRIVLGLSILLAQTVVANDYIPDVLELDGTNGLSFPPDSSLTLVGGSTIEFWLAPDWQSAPGYEPVVLSNTGEEGPLYLIAMLPDRQGLVFYSGDQRMVAPFDFTDSQMHFIAIVDLGDTINILVDNLLIAQGEMSFAGLPSSGLWVGSADGESFPFVGAVGGLRIWDVPLDPFDLVEFAMKDIEDQAVQHPDIESLVAISRFRSQTLFLTDLVP
jgi:hypothetical protein